MVGSERGRDPEKRKGGRGGREGGGRERKSGEEGKGYTWKMQFTGHGHDTRQWEDGNGVGW